MSATYQVAVDEMLDVVKAAWDPTGHDMQYPDKPDEKPKGRDPYGRVTIRHVDGSQRTLSGATGSQTWGREGFITVQVFTPIGKGLSESYALCRVVTNAYEGKSTPSNVWFRNIRINEAGNKGEWQQVNVIIDFTYDEVK